MKTISDHKSHPWHGIDLGPNCPAELRAFIEIVPTDTVKYEIDKASGYLSLDRPQKFSNIVPSLYGFVPRSYCGPKMAALTQKIYDSKENPEKKEITGDGDPLDICVLSEKSVTHGDIIVKCIPIGGIALLDNGQADDKIIAVLKHDAVYGYFKDISELPEKITNRLLHYFSTYKEMPGEGNHKMEVVGIYGAEHAREVIMQALEDYKDYIFE